MLELCKDGRIEIEEFILNLPGVPQLIGTISINVFASPQCIRLAVEQVQNCCSPVSWFHEDWDETQVPGKQCLSPFANLTSEDNNLRKFPVDTDTHHSGWNLPVLDLCHILNLPKISMAPLIPWSEGLKNDKWGGWVMPLCQLFEAQMEATHVFLLVVFISLTQQSFTVKECNASCGLPEQLQERSVTCQAWMDQTGREGRCWRPQIKDV